MLGIKKIPVTELEQNCRIVACASTGDYVIVDPGGEAQKILAELPQDRAPVGIWLTHSHFDHCGGVQELLRILRQRYPAAKIPLYAHAAESHFRSRVGEVAALWGLGGFENCPEPDHFISEKQPLQLGEYEVTVLWVPGHSPGHVAFYIPSAATLIAGDTVFAGSIGRTDLPGGNHQQLLTSIRQKILTLPAETKVLPGHGSDTTIAAELATNPYLR